MLDYSSLRAVALVARTGSFEKAAQAMHVTPSAVSQRIKQLEERMGVVLIVRGNPCVATEKGEWLCRHMDHVGMLESELFQRLPALADSGVAREPVTLNIATNADSLGTWFLDAVSKFTGGSDYLVNIAVDDQDHTVEWLRAGRVLAAVTAHDKPVQGCRVTPLGVLRYHATASPDFMARHFAEGVTSASLSRAPGLTFNQKDRLQANWIRKVLGKDVSYPTHWLPSTDGFVKASLAGMGWGLNPVQLVAEHLTAQRLVEVVPGTPLDTPLYWQVNRLAAERLKGLTDAVVGTARAVLVV
ncbi:LysR family Transcription regulator [Agrobacterium tumefaciens]|uniref:Transcriptional regulator ArgP n=1 Tax=Agrobacterium tumefaciens TaxID=358 RepID=A0A176WZ96_AGRTU|nr:LysR family transcriptional regulator ArgP [Agrobacterium tumefaciens]OAE38302.1 transcriptional regulator ArgP [Agrobacterium tumefaciens]QTK79198.1 LysR family Transcription regulator [Agrobacterium tumefaciens]